MAGAVRLGDKTTGICDLGLECCSHSRSGTVTSVSSNVNVNGAGLHRLNDTGPTNCPHGGTFSSTEGSDTVFCNSRPVVRIGDATKCSICGQPGSHNSGSGNVFVGG